MIDYLQGLERIGTGSLSGKNVAGGQNGIQTSAAEDCAFHAWITLPRCQPNVIKNSVKYKT